MARITQSTYESLCQRLGKADAERRAVLKLMKQTPEFVSKYLQDSLKSFIASGQWFSRTNAKGELAYFKLVGYTFGGKETVASITKKGSTLISVNLEWDYYDYNAVSKKKATEQLTISVFNDIEGQILNGRKQASSFDEKKLLRAQLTEKKKKLEEELKTLKLELTKI